MTKIPVYLMPGLAASSLIFERIALPKDTFEIYLLDWFLPENKETLESYAKRMAQKVTHDNAVLIGVSFGGILVQEMKAFLSVRKVIIISSVKNNHEFPMRFKIAKPTKAYKMVPTSLLANLEVFAKYAFGEKIKDRVALYERFLAMRNKQYLDWAIAQVILWKRTQTDPEIIHIHGDADEVFPVKNIKNAILIKGGTHIMILSKYKWLNENLPKIISN